MSFEWAKDNEIRGASQSLVRAVKKSKYNTCTKVGELHFEKGGISIGRLREIIVIISLLRHVFIDLWSSN